LLYFQKFDWLSSVSTSGLLHIYQCCLLEPKIKIRFLAVEVYICFFTIVTHFAVPETGEAVLKEQKDMSVLLMPRPFSSYFAAYSKAPSVGCYICCFIQGCNNASHVRMNPDHVISVVEKTTRIGQ